ncbi:MAG TPA: hypothetical protein VLY24_02650 [Bryobacteraceae bacterium]|nr:hypothetical protein [Bryobacteraceae bacterium]
MTQLLERAGRWLIESGIQEPCGGVARYYRTDLRQNLAVSTEITGYALGTLLYLGALTKQTEYGAHALQAAHFLTRHAWDGDAMPFEVTPDEDQLTYFFDCGIIAGNLLAAWRATREQEFYDVAKALGTAMAIDFASCQGDYHPVLTLPEKKPVERDALRWSHSAGCYQLKAALVWCDLAEATGDPRFGALYEQMIESALRSYGSFLPGHPDPSKVVDRLHAFLYFLEGLLPRANEKRCAAVLCDGIRKVSHFLAENAPEFERADVYAQLLRIRLYADWLGASPLDREAAEREAAEIESFLAGGDDPREDGGFYFGRRAGQFLPFVNPVSTAFSLQALALWERYSNGCPPVHWRTLI